MERQRNQRGGGRLMPAKMVPGRTTMDGKLIEEYNSLAPPLFKTEWFRRPVGPFRVQVWHESQHPSTVVAEVHEEFGSAMECVAFQYMPPAVGYTVLLLDESFHVVFGSCAASDVLDQTNGQVGWYGVRVAFEWLEQNGRYDWLDLAVWEGRAMQSATGAPV